MERRLRSDPSSATTHPVSDPASCCFRGTSEPAGTRAGHRGCSNAPGLRTGSITSARTRSSRPPTASLLVHLGRSQDVTRSMPLSEEAARSSALPRFREAARSRERCCQLPAPGVRARLRLAAEGTEVREPGRAPGNRIRRKIRLGIEQNAARVVRRRSRAAVLRGRSLFPTLCFGFGRGCGYDWGG